MKIAVLSDTHIPTQATDMPAEAYATLSDADLIIHSGDIVSIQFLEKLKKISSVRAVYGNMDYPEVRQALPKKDIVECEGFKIGIFHGNGPPNEILQRAGEEFDEKLDVIIFGHSHKVVNETVGETLFLNPGSPTDNVFAPYRSLALLNVGEKIESEIIKLP